ncbi:unnamed protein product [Notodromas monacha]|uniref:Uncharacterized protein n=1 Tax=Notodromas monacha TaxID=399045 RepID=A0A7R9BHN7_9CRUS|nr:unnamed protein product [Notodromas monacha]CAG0914096.1 unnamed protein product [Notodromas monacha]
MRWRVKLRRRLLGGIGGSGSSSQSCIDEFSFESFSPASVAAANNGRPPPVGVRKRTGFMSVLDLSQAGLDSVGKKPAAQPQKRVSAPGEFKPPIPKPAPKLPPPKLPPPLSEAGVRNGAKPKNPAPLPARKKAVVPPFSVHFSRRYPGAAAEAPAQKQYVRKPSDKPGPSGAFGSRKSEPPGNQAADDAHKDTPDAHPAHSKPHLDFSET